MRRLKITFDNWFLYFYRAKEWKKKRKKDYKPRLFNEKEIGNKKISENMNKIQHIYFKVFVKYNNPYISSSFLWKGFCHWLLKSLN